MNRIAPLWRSTIGQKIVMGATGIIMVAFLIGHVAGNLLVFWGADAINGYARALRVHYVLLWTARAVLIASVLLHIAAAAALTTRDLRARRIGYARLQPQASTWASRTMRWTGVLLALFIVFHLLHLTTGTIRPAPFDGPNVYGNLVGGFHVPWVVALYVIAMILLALHLYHGIWAALRTLGVAPLSPAPLRRPLGFAVTVALWLGFTIIPLAILAGMVG
jgi:succinate dehydrogenase / fumarate reductase cytochrome b subunit